MSAAPNLNAWEMLERGMSPIDDRPRLRPGFETTAHLTRRGEPYWVVRCPAPHAYLKLSAREFALLPMLDGSRTVKELAIGDYERNGSLDFPLVAGLVRSLLRKGFLMTPYVDAYAGLARRTSYRGAAGLVKRVASSFRESEIGTSGLDGAFGWIYRRLAWPFFTRIAFIAGLALVAIGLAAFIAEFERGRYPLFRAYDSFLLGLLLFGALDAVSLIIHEAGHAVAARHAGRHVSRAGFMLYYGFPAGFVDTTDVWMASRRQRLITSFAGTWTGLILGAVTGILAFFLPDGAAGALFFQWTFVCAFNTVLNLNPLIELDGYYILVDLIEQPMLRARSLAFVRGPFWRKLATRVRLTRDEWLLASFGLAAFGASAGLLGLAVWSWRARIYPVVRDAWRSDRPWEQAAVVLLGLMVGVPLLLALRSGLASGLGASTRLLRRTGRRTRVLRHRRVIEALRRSPTWASLPDASLTRIADAMRRESVTAGAVVVIQGEPGDRFYLIETGRFEVAIDGRPVAELGPGDYFGDRALLSDTPRTATVTASAGGSLYSLGRADFDHLIAADVAAAGRIRGALDLRTALQYQPLFSALSPTELDLLVVKFEPHSFADGAVAIREGDLADRFYVVESGRVAVTREGRPLGELGPGDVFGEIALTIGGVRTATVTTVGKVAVRSLSKADFDDALAAYCGRAGELERLSHLRLEAQRAAPSS